MWTPHKSEALLNVGANHVVRGPALSVPPPYFQGEEKHNGASIKTPGDDS